MYEITGESYGYANGNPLSNIDPSGMFINPIGIVEWYSSKANTKINDTLSYIHKNRVQISTKLYSAAEWIQSFQDPIADVASNTIAAVIENSGYISSGLILAGLGVSATGIGSPVGAGLIAGGTLMGGISASFEISKCTELEITSGYTCDPLAVGLSTAGVFTGAAPKTIAKLIKIEPIDIENLSVVLGMIGSAEAAGASAIHNYRETELCN